MAYGDTIEYKLRDGKVIRLTYTANTYLIYKRFFGSDLMSDIIKATSADKPLPKDIQDQIASGELTVDNLDSADLSGIDGAVDTTFILQAIIAMVATYERATGVRRGVEEIADEIPPYLFMDADFMQDFTEFLMFGLKKTEQGASQRLSSVLVERK